MESHCKGKSVGKKIAKNLFLLFCKGSRAGVCPLPTYFVLRLLLSLILEGWEVRHSVSGQNHVHMNCMSRYGFVVTCDGCSFLGLVIC